MFFVKFENSRKRLIKIFTKQQKLRTILGVSNEAIFGFIISGF